MRRAYGTPFQPLRFPNPGSYSQASRVLEMGSNFQPNTALEDTPYHTLGFTDLISLSVFLVSSDVILRSAASCYPVTDRTSQEAEPLATPDYWVPLACGLILFAE